MDRVHSFKPIIHNVLEPQPLKNLKIHKCAIVKLHNMSTLTFQYSFQHVHRVPQIMSSCSDIHIEHVYFSPEGLDSCYNVLLLYIHKFNQNDRYRHAQQYDFTKLKLNVHNSESNWWIYFKFETQKEYTLIFPLDEFWNLLTYSNSCRTCNKLKCMIMTEYVHNTGHYMRSNVWIYFRFGPHIAHWNLTQPKLLSLG